MKFTLSILSITALVGVAAFTTGCAVTREQETVGAYVDDAAITTRIKAQMVKDPTVDAAAIRVETLKGEVQLAGFAKSAIERAKAESIARETSGVKRVRNDIIVRN